MYGNKCGTFFTGSMIESRIAEGNNGIAPKNYKQLQVTDGKYTNSEFTSVGN